jgi:hypothetical protein
MRSEKDIADLRAIAAQAGTSAEDTEMVMNNFCSMRCDKLQARFALKFYAEHPHAGQSGPYQQELDRHRRHGNSLGRPKASFLAAIAVSYESIEESESSSVVAFDNSVALAQRSPAVNAEGRLADQIMRSNSTVARPLAASAEERLADEIVHSNDAGTARPAARNAEEQFADQAVDQYLKGRGRK